MKYASEFGFYIIDSRKTETASGPRRVCVCVRHVLFKQLQEIRFL
jgi:hypothetical protein